MTLRRKLAVTTIAASVAMSAFAGIPLSNKGLAEKLGVSGIVSATSYNSFVNEVNKVYTELAKIQGGVEAVEALKVEIDSALSDDVDISELLLKIAGSDPSLVEELEDLIGDLIVIPVSSDWQTKFETEYRTKYNGLLTEVADQHNLEGKLTVDDLGAFFFTLQKNFANLLVDFDPALITTIKDQLKNAAKSALNSNARVKELATKAEITENDLSALYTALLNSSHVRFTTVATAFGYLNQAYKAANPVSPNPNPGTGGGGGFPPATIEIPQEAKELESKLEELKEQLENASDEERAALIEQAVADALSVVDKLSNIGAGVTVADGKATLQLDENKALSAIAGIGVAVASLKDATGAEIPAPTITIDLGAVAEDEIAIDLSNNIVAEAIKAGLGAVELQVGGLKVELPFGGTFSNAIEFNIVRADASEEATGGLNAASRVYTFELLVGGVATTTFSKPIVIGIPLGDTAGLDTELLSVAKILEDGSLEIHGGRVQGNLIVESRDTFSSYVVVENKVSFRDTASVAAWAGRAIEVIAAKGAIIGKSEGVFAPADQVTRAEFAKMLIHALDLDNASAKEGFADVNPGDWFAPYVAAAAELKIINGRSATRFDPHAKITRAEMATMISRALKAARGAAEIEDVDAALSVFSDAGQISASLQEGVAFAAEHGIVIGNEGKFSPNNNATRAQAAVIIYRAFKFE